MMKRRTFLQYAVAAGALPLWAGPVIGSDQSIIARQIPSTGEKIPVVGMGTWITFNVGSNETLRRSRLDVLKTFFELGGGVVDSSPMYGSAQSVLGWCLERIPKKEAQGLFSATKIWTPAGGSGPKQITDARTLWRQNHIDAMQVHNLVDWKSHLASMRAARDQGHIRYIGITTSHGLRHEEMMGIMATEPLDFIQLTYNIADREPEKRLLPMAADRGIGVIINRPFQRGALFRRLEGKPLPAWSMEYGIQSWSQFLLKFIISHPAVTCTIPATSKVEHMRENMAVLRGALPDMAARKRMIDYVSSL